MKVCKKAVISGRVQGVFYRQNTVDQAKLLGITGWVKNLPNGDVEALLCGDAEKVDILCEWLWDGPAAARVSDVKLTEMPWHDFSQFRVVR